MSEAPANSGPQTEARTEEGFGARGKTTLVPERPEPPSMAARLRREKVFSSLFGRPDAAPLTIERFTLLECIGVGGMGELYAAYDPRLDRRVAIKLVRPERRGGAELERRLLREAQAAARVSHPNVVQVYEAGVFEGRVFVAMEFVRGEDLGAWLAAAPREPDDLLRRFIEAGRGLAAVHAAELAHRDFKPGNALLGDDGRVRIVDFGLARNVREASAEPGPEPEPGHDRTGVDDDTTATRGPTGSAERGLGTMTAPGTIMGTPRYMAPEQWRGARGDARSDQFSFCVALYEALYGVVPFRADDTDELLEAIAARRIEPPRRAVKAPRSLREAIVRGLADDPEQRWPSMDALLTELERPLVRSKRRWLGLAAIVAVAAAGGIGAALATDDVHPRCAIDEAILAETWDEERHLALTRAFEATGSSFASRSAQTVAGALDDWSAAWLSSRREACEATWVEGVQSEALLDRRTACLNRKRQAFEVVVDSFVAADADLLARADELLAELPDLGECSNPRALETGARMPDEPEAAARILVGYETLARARVLRLRGRADEARGLSEPLTRSAYAPLALEARTLLASLTIPLALEPGLLALRDAADEADVLGLLELEATIRVLLAREAVGDWSKPDLEVWLIDEAERLLDRLAQPDDPRRLSLLTARALHREQLGDYAGARELIEQGIALAADDRPVRHDGAHEQLTGMRMALANIERKRANYDAARTLYLELLVDVRERWGERHPMLAPIEYNLGVLALDRGQFEDGHRWLSEARTRYLEAGGAGSIPLAEVEFALAKLALSNGEFERAEAQILELLPIFEAELGLEHENTARAHAALGVVRFYTGDLAGSLASYRRALPVFERVLGPGNDEVALMHANVGESLLGLGRHAEAVEACDHALELLERALSPDHPYLGVPLKVRGLALLEVGRTRDAVDDLERAVALLAAEGDEPLELADARFALARALLTDAPVDATARARARELLAASITGFAELGLDDRVAAVEAWRANDG